MVSAQHVIDGRSLMPPEPLELTLAALDTLQTDDELVLLLYCVPHPLYAVLDKNGYRHRTDTRPDGTVEVHITHAG